MFYVELSFFTAGFFYTNWQCVKYIAKFSEGSLDDSASILYFGLANFFNCYMAMFVYRGFGSHLNRMEALTTVNSTIMIVVLLYTSYAFYKNSIYQRAMRVSKAELYSGSSNSNIGKIKKRLFYTWCASWFLIFGEVVIVTLNYFAR